MSAETGIVLIFPALIGCVRIKDPVYIFKTSSHCFRYQFLAFGTEVLALKMGSKKAPVFGAFKLNSSQFMFFDKLEFVINIYLLQERTIHPDKHQEILHVACPVYV